MAKKGDLVTFLYSYYKRESSYEAMRRMSNAEICAVKIVRNVYARRVLAVSETGDVAVNFKKQKLWLSRGNFHVV